MRNILSKIPHRKLAGTPWIQYALNIFMSAFLYFGAVLMYFNCAAYPEDLFVALCSVNCALQATLITKLLKFESDRITFLRANNESVVFLSPQITLHSVNTRLFSASSVS